MATICAVNEILLGSDSDPSSKVNLKKLVSDGAARAAQTTQDPQSRDELQRAVLDIFTERTGEVFDWLARIAERFVALCSLGLEATSADEIRKILLRYQLTLDTDIVLTYLCDGEPDHGAAVELLNRWLGINGEVMLATTVLQEVANHAWIADRHFESMVLTATEAAQYLKVKPRTLLQWVRQGKICGYQLSGTVRHVWRFKRVDLDSAMLCVSSADSADKGAV